MAVSTAPRAHANPVYGGYFADPFVWNHQGVYYAVGTGELEATGRTSGPIFPVLQSSDFYQWHRVGNALLPPDPHLGRNFWAPAVACAEGLFYLYYSVGHGDQHHRLRVATSSAPAGPYRDLGLDLLDVAACPFSIDPHPFRDEDGQWYLYYARDFLDTAGGARAGTGLMVSRLQTMTRLDEPGTVVLRARSDWQRFQRSRRMYGRTWDWHTLEGPCAWKHDGRYYCFYSGGRWEDETYGVDYGVADHVLGPYSDAGNEAGPRVLRTVPGRVLGPGHNCLAAGPEGATEYIVYHAWDRQRQARRMFIDRLIWTPAGPRCEGPTGGDTIG